MVTWYKKNILSESLCCNCLQVLGNVQGSPIFYSTDTDYNFKGKAWEGCVDNKTDHQDCWVCVPCMENLGLIW